MCNFKSFRFILVWCFVVCAAVLVNAQSSDQNFPTPITTNQLSGTIRARDIGDSRLTTYFFTFYGNQGDVFVNVVTTNLNGDIDVFAAEGLRPLTKIVVYADNSDNETGRVIYLRKPEKILIRIQGRSPNDDPATFQIKFAGSFVASTETDQNDDPKLPDVKRNENSDVIVNSVGTIIGTKPKPTPEPKTDIAKKSDKEEPEQTVAETNAEKTEPKNVEKTEPEVSEKPQVVVTDVLEKEKKAEEDKIVAEKKEKPAEVKKERVRKTREKPKKATEPDPLENIRLIVLMKDGGKIERPMSEILKFGVEKGVLTIISKDGTIGRYSILDVEKVTIE